MRVLLINQYFYPDMAATAQIMTDLAVDLARAGVTVTVITGRASYNGDATYSASEEYEGVSIRRVAATSFGRKNLAWRALDFGSFMAAAAFELTKHRNDDIVVTMSTPPLLSLLGVAAQVVAHSQFVYWVQDLYPDVAIELGMLRRDSSTARILEILSRSSLKRADGIVAIGECMAAQLRRRDLNETAVAVIHNWADGQSIQPVAHEHNWFRDQHGLGENFVALYSGNMGRGHRFDTILDAARILNPQSRFRFVFIGDGAKRELVERESVGLDNVLLLPYQPRKDLRFSLSAADVALISLEDPMNGLMVPSKIYGHLASGRAIAFIGPKSSSAARIVIDSGCGRVFRHGDSNALADFLRELANDPHMAESMGEQGRAYFDAYFERTKSTTEFTRLLRRLAS